MAGEWGISNWDMYIDNSITHIAGLMAYCHCGLSLNVNMTEKLRPREDEEWYCTKPHINP